MSALPGLGTTSVRGRRWQKSPVTGESSKETVKTIACGNAGCFWCTRCYSCAFYHYKCTRGRGCSGHPAFPTPSLGAKVIATPRALRVARTKWYARLYQRHCERSEAINSFFSLQDGLLRGACHRAAPCADPLARNDEEIPFVRLERHAARRYPSPHGRRNLVIPFHLHPSARRTEHVSRCVGSCGAAGARHRAADAVRRLPRAGSWRGRLRNLLGQAVVHRTALLPAARHSLCLRSRSRPAVDGSDRRSAGLCARSRRGAL